MDIDLLKTFLEVSQTQHFGKAADKLYLTQSAVSARIRLLENELGCALFSRNKKQVQLTPEGEKFVSHANTMLAQWVQARQELSGIHQNDNPLCLTSHAQLWQWPFASQLAQLDSPWQSKTLGLEEAWQDLYQQKTDLLLTYQAASQTGFTQVKLGQLPLALCAAGQHLTTPSSWQNLAYLHVDYGPLFEQFSQRHLRHKPASHGICDHPSLAVAVLKQHAVCAYLPLAIIDECAELTLIQHNKAPRFKQRLVAVYANQSAHKTRIQAQLAQLKF